MNTRPSAIFLIHQIMKDVYKFLSLHGVKNTTKIAVGVIENRHFPKDIDKLLKESKALANLALEDDTLKVVINNNLFLMIAHSIIRSFFIFSIIF